MIRMRVDLEQNPFCHEGRISQWWNANRFIENSHIEKLEPWHNWAEDSKFTSLRISVLLQPKDGATQQYLKILISVTKIAWWCYFEL